MSTEQEREAVARALLLGISLRQWVETGIFPGRPLRIELGGAQLENLVALCAQDKPGRKPIEEPQIEANHMPMIKHFIPPV